LSPPVYRTLRPKQFGWIAMIIAVVGAFGVEKKCFGSAGCSVTYRIEPSASGHDVRVL
jgi:hypothetical protein